MISFVCSRDARESRASFMQMRCSSVYVILHIELSHRIGIFSKGRFSNEYSFFAKILPEFLCQLEIHSEIVILCRSKSVQLHGSKSVLR